MVNSEFCFLNGSKCWRDKDRNGTFDGAAKGWKDVPYEVFEIRERDQGAGSHAELAVESVAPDRVDFVFREYLAKMNEPYRTEKCTGAPGSPLDCFDFRLELGVVDGDAIEFTVGRAPG